jgi:hypothetical protein
MCPGVRPDDEIVAKTPLLFLDSEAPAAGTTLPVAIAYTELVEILTFPLSVLCDETVAARARVKTQMQHVTVKILRFIWPPSFDRDAKQISVLSLHPG